MWILTVALFLVVISLWIRWRKQKFSTFEELGIPGPRPSIFTGNLGELLKSTPIDCHNRWMKKYGKVVGYYYGRHPTLLVADVDLAKKILIKDFHKFANRPNCHFKSDSDLKKEEAFSAQLTALKNKRWKEIRSIITPSFTTSKMKMMSQTMSNSVDSLMNTIEKLSKTGQAFEIYELYKRLTLDVIGRAAFGIQTDVQNRPDDTLKAAKLVFEANVYSIFRILALSFPEFASIWKILQTIRLTIQGQGRNPVTEMANHARKLLHLRRSSEKYRRNDLLQIMMDAKISESDLKSITNEELTAEDIDTEDRKKNNEKDNDTAKKMLRMTDHEIVDNSMTFYLAGYETTSTALAFITHLLIHYPEVQRNIREEVRMVFQKEGKLDYNAVQQMKYLEQVIMEALRMYPPLYLFVNRRAEEDVQYGKYKIKKDLQIQIPVYNMNHDPDVWEDPEKFNPNRFSPENRGTINYIAFQTFGAGPRNCVGMRFAQLEMKLALANILNKYELVKTPESDKEPITLSVRTTLLAPAKGIILKAMPL